ncbi:hypothetical protein Pcinc_010072 [Petrolisthes cinctipes]|uniref:Uncharacterized protein n=1 Tax=Petrolisthes cinctipes TaxID=88211 RepID=A0AAE1G3H5_PETCI|nr:hypothetical protein Pcinc_010072 [Petrolisthes cinctipes]
MANVKAKRNVCLAMVTLTFIVYQVTLYHYQDDIPTFTKNIPPASLLSAYNTISVTAHPFVVATRLKERRDRMRKACEEVDHPKTISNTLARILYAPSHDMFVCASPKFTTTFLRFNPSGIADSCRMSQVIALTSCDSGSGCDHVQIFKTFAGHLCNCRIARLVAAWTQCERSSVAARCNMATTAYVKALHSRATPPPSDVAATHRPYIRCPLDASQRQSNDLPATTNQPPPAPP